MISEESQFLYDVFVSYRWLEPDQTWVRKHFVPALRRSGLRVCLDVTDFIPGRDLIWEMTRAGKESRRAVCILSPDYFQGNRFVHFESLLLRRQDPAGMDGRLIPLVLRQCEVPEWLRGLVAVDWTREAALSLEWAKLLTALGARNLTSSAPCALEELATATIDPNVRELFDVEEATRWVQASVEPAQRNAVVTGLVAEAERRLDPTERYWVYIALGEIGNHQAQQALRKFEKSERNAFAKGGVSEALLTIERLSRKNPKNKKHEHTRKVE
jgi:hypothetical protein